VDPKDRIGMSLAFVFLIGMGVWALLDPDAMGSYEAVGRRAGLKQMVANYWGVKLGLALIVLGGLALVGIHTNKDT
jgi:hypothetical protein